MRIVMNERDSLYRFEELPMAAVAEGFSALFDRTELFLRVVAQWPVRDN